MLKSLTNVKFENFLREIALDEKKCLPLQPQNERKGALAQLVEHRTENPCVPGSIPGGTTPPFISPVKV